MSRTISIAPVSRIEGHARISIHLGEAGQVHAARLHVEEFRGFEAFCVGRPYWEMPGITSRICGICPVSHALASAQACERIMGITAPQAARRQRSLLSLAQLLLSHSLSFFHLSGPDIILGLDADPAKRNIIGLAQAAPELIRKGVRLRQIGQQIVNLVGGGHLHPEWIVPGGMRQQFPEQGRDTIAALMPEALELVLFARKIWGDHKDRFLLEMGEYGDLPGLHLGLVTADGCLDYTNGRLCFADDSGQAMRTVTPDFYSDAIRETMPGDSYMKPTRYCSGPPAPGQHEPPLYRVGPLARLHVAPFAQTPRSEAARTAFLAERDISSSSLGYHPSRLIEMLHAVERITGLLDDPQLCAPHTLARAEVNNLRGVGVTEAPRGTLIHDYHVDKNGLLTGVNLIVATGHNSEAMDRTITAIARRHITSDKLTEGLLNRVEHGIRLYDPCLSCATHMHGRSGIAIELLDSRGRVLDQR